MHDSNAKKINEINAIRQAKSDYITAMSHDLKTPLVAIVGIGEILKNELKDSKYQALLTDLESASNTILSLVKDILGLTRLESGHLELLFEPFDLLKLIEGVVTTMSHQCLEKGVELLISYPPHIPRILISDSSAIRRIVINLLSNAIKFTDSGYIHIKVIEQEYSEKEVKLNIVVEDTGIGIPEDYILHERNQMDSVDIENKSQNAGLSIFIVKQLVAGLGGIVKLENNPGKGAQFSCELTFANSNANKNKVMLTNNRPSLRILIVSDQAHSSESMAELLAYEQFSICSAHQCLNKLEEAQLHNKAYNIVIVDDKLMDPTLLSVATQIRSKVAHSDTLIIYAAFPLSLTQIEQVKALDFNEIINKPILPSRFTNQLHSAWERHLKNDKTFKAVATSTNLTTKLPSPSTPSDKHQVLLVEDNAVVRKITRLLLEKLDCEVDIAVNGEEALTLSRAKVYDLVFLDIDLPDIDGISVCRALRANSGPNQNSTLVALTGQIVEKEAKICLAAGMNAFLEKPASSTNFMRIIQQFIVDKPELA